MKKAFNVNINKIHSHSQIFYAYDLPRKQKKGENCGIFLHRAVKKTPYQIFMGLKSNSCVMRSLIC